MSTNQKNLSSYNALSIPSALDFNFAIVVSDYNQEITGALYDGAINTLIKHGAIPDNIIVKHVPGTFELPLAGQWMAEYFDVDAVICIGCVIKGDTDHDQYINQAVSQSLAQLSIEYSIPFVFGILTTNNLEQAQDRAGGKLGNKGIEAAVTAIRMASLKSEMEE
jgi:6,7-dimethyl-8-ribityllumazine synthase